MTDQRAGYHDKTKDKEVTIELRSLYPSKINHIGVAETVNWINHTSKYQMQNFA